MTYMREKQRALSIGELSSRAAALRAKKMNFAEIGLVMNISSIKARDLCIHYDRYSGLSEPLSYRFELSKRAIVSLLSGAHAARFGGDMNKRLENFIQIAASYRRSELLAEQLVGPVLCDEIENWLASRALRFRRERAAPLLEPSALTGLTAKRWLNQAEQQLRHQPA